LFMSIGGIGFDRNTDLIKCQIVALLCYRFSWYWEQFYLRLRLEVFNSRIIFNGWDVTIMLKVTTTTTANSIRYNRYSRIRVFVIQISFTTLHVTTILIARNHPVQCVQWSSALMGGAR